jgi:hypothetical protein
MYASRVVIVLYLLANETTFAQSNIDNTIPNKRAWGENFGWTNWYDANGALQGVAVGDRVLSGFIWAENAGWINVGDGTPGSVCGNLPCYANVNGTDFGVNIDPDGELHGYAWGENIGWINFDGGAMASPPQPARFECADSPGQPLARLTGYAWGENVGWINLADLTAGKFVAVDAATTPLVCDMNHDGFANGLDIQTFVDAQLGAAANWRDVCSGDVEVASDGAIDLDDIQPFVNCLLN